MLKDDILKFVNAKADKTIQLAKDIWGYAEMQYAEFKSSKALIDALEEEGFTVESGIADMPTAFKATYVVGNGKPKLALLGEYDALDAMSQVAAQPKREAIDPGAPGHGCGHNLLGAGSFAAAAALKDYLIANNGNATIMYFGCPAEEGAGAKQFIARAGYFDDIDFVYTWHPSTMNQISSKSNVAIIGANFIFDGVSSHPGSAPHLGRSALDAAELMNVGCNYLREHMIDQARVHYAYSDAGGTFPNVIPSHAVIKYEVRAPKVAQMRELFARVVDIARGAALMTGTKMNYEITMAFSDFVQNKTLAAVMQESFEEAGVPDWTDDDYKLASEFLRTYSKDTLIGIKEGLKVYFDEDEIDEVLLKPMDTRIHGFDPKEDTYISGSTDVGDVGYAAPTVELKVASACIGNVNHSWQNTAFMCSNIGFKGMMKAVEVLVLACVKTIERPEVIEKAKKELLKKNGGKYSCPLPADVKPPIGRY